MALKNAEVKIREDQEEEITKAEFNGDSNILEMDSNSKLGHELIPRDPYDQSQNGKLLATK